MDKDVTSVTKSLDRIADALEGKSGGGSSGGGAEPFVIEAVDHTDRYDVLTDKTWSEIASAFRSGQVCIINGGRHNVNMSNVVLEVASANDLYYVFTKDDTYYVNTENGYPHIYYGD